MKSCREMDYYELLEISRGAAAEEIDRAYALLREAYEPGSLAAYSVFDEPEAAVLRDQIDVAYAVLSDPERRRAYDASLKGLTTQDEREAPLPDLEGGSGRSTALNGFEDIDDGDIDAPWDGARLRRSRLARGVDLEAIASVTKVNPAYLRFLEEDRFDALPAPVYVRGFVDAYARYLGLEARRIAGSYIERFQRHYEQQQKPHGRLLSTR
jgi:flagellar biosynthesis protein FlhG